MPTDKQKLGEYGEKIIVKSCACPKCKRKNTFKRLPNNFKCADIICDFCGYQAQVKTKNVSNVNVLPSKVTSAAWGPQKERMDSGIYFSLYLVLVDKRNNHQIYFLPSDLQIPEMFEKRKPLSPDAKRSGWQGFYYNLNILGKDRLIRL